MAARQHDVDVGGDFFFAVMGGDGRPGFALANLVLQFADFRLVGGRRQRVDLQIAGHHHRPRAKLAETVGVEFGLGDDKRQVFEQRFGKIAAPLP